MVWETAGFPMNPIENRYKKRKNTQLRKSRGISRKNHAVLKPKERPTRTFRKKSKEEQKIINRILGEKETFL